MLPRPPYRVFLGFDAAEMRACNVAEQSLYRHSSRSEVRVERVCRLSLGQQYTRPTTTMPSGQLFDDISGAPMSTDHAIARFFVPSLCGYQGWALFTDGDTMFREDVRQLFALADDRYAVQVVQHVLDPWDGYYVLTCGCRVPGRVAGRNITGDAIRCDRHPDVRLKGVVDAEPLLKKGSHIQQPYPRKNWSSVCLWNCGHPSNAALTPEVLNSRPGRDLHAFRWLKDEEIGTLPTRWNHLVNVNPHDSDAAIAHFTLGTCDLPGHEHDPFADEWFAVARMAGYQFKERVGR